MITDQKVGGSSPSERANVCKCFLEIVLFKNFEGGNEGGNTKNIRIDLTEFEKQSTGGLPSHPTPIDMY